MQTCPVCSAVSFEDATVCYGCLHRFKQSDSKESPKEDSSTSAPSPSFESASASVPAPAPAPASASLPSEELKFPLYAEIPFYLVPAEELAFGYVPQTWRVRVELSCPFLDEADSSLEAQKGTSAAKQRLLQAPLQASFEWEPRFFQDLQSPAMQAPMMQGADKALSVQDRRASLKTRRGIPRAVLRRQGRAKRLKDQSEGSPNSLEQESKSEEASLLQEASLYREAPLSREALLPQETLLS